jgi:hypothetical protein
VRVRESVRLTVEVSVRPQSSWCWILSSSRVFGVGQYLPPHMKVEDCRLSLGDDLETGSDLKPSRMAPKGDKCKCVKYRKPDNGR